MQCNNCQTENREGVKFCESCGGNLETPCPACNTLGPPDRKFCGECGTAIAIQATTPAHPPTEPAISGSPERRHLTVMFCDLVGSTDMATRFDAEDVSDVIRLFNEAAEEVIRKYDGYIARHVGDGMLCYFGYPRALEDSAERSVLAGLDLIESVSKLKPAVEVTLQTRVGIASGEVIAGETVLGDAHTETLAIGSTPNLAARLQSLADPNTVYVADSTRRLIRMGIEWKDHGNQEVKGYSQAQSVWQAIGRSTSTPLDNETGSRFPGNAIVGRDRELQQIFDGYENAKAGNAQIVQLIGEAGIGKSALVYAMRQRLRSEEHFETVLHCSNLATDTPLFPIKQGLEALAKIRPSDAAKEKSASLVNLFVDSPAMDPLSIACVGQLVGITINGEIDKSSLTTRQQNARALDALLAWIDEVAAKQTLVLIIEDVHWIDPSTLEWLSGLIETRTQGRLLLLITSRPEFRTPWDIAANVDVVNVKRLSASSCAEIINNIVGENVLPPKLLESLLDKTEGIPLFVEELTNTLLDAVANAADNMESTIAALNVPNSLRDSLMARLDRTPEIRDVIQIASVVGREFSAPLLCSITSRPLEEVNPGLKQMEEAGVLRQRNTQTDPTWIFKHALLRDAAYESILRSRRKELHSKVADALTNQDTVLIDNRAEVLATHLGSAGRSQEAITQWKLAADKAAENWSNIEAARHLHQAVELLMSESESEDRRKQELELRYELGNIERAAFGTGSAQAFETLQRTAALWRETDNIETILKVRDGEFNAYFGAARLKECKPSAIDLLKIGEQHQDKACIIAGHQCCGMQCFAVGDMDKAKHHLEAALSHGLDWPSEVLDVQYPSVCQAYLSWTLHMMGDSERALQVSEESIDYSENGPAYSHALSLANACYLHQLRGDPARVRQIAERTLAFVADKDLVLWRDISDFFLRWAICTEDPTVETVTRFCDALDLWAEDEIETPYFKAIAGEACIRAGMNEQGVTLLNQSEDLMQHTGELWYYHELKAMQKRLGV